MAFLCIVSLRCISVKTILGFGKIKFIFFLRLKMNFVVKFRGKIETIET